MRYYSDRQGHPDTVKVRRAERGLGVAWVLAFALLAAPCAADETVRIFLAGDSTMAAKLPDKRPETGWGEMLQDGFPVEQVRVENHAMNGRSTRTFLEEGRWAAILAELHAGDYVFIQFGHNDQSTHKPKRYTPPGNYRSNLVRFVNDVRARDATPVLLTPVVRRRFDEAGVFYDTHGEYPDLVREAAVETGAVLIDMHANSAAVLREYGPDRSKALFLWLAPDEFPNYPEGLEDNTHFSPLGAKVMAGLVLDDLTTSLPELARLSLPVP